MQSLFNEFPTISDVIASIIAIVGGAFGLYKWLRSRPFRKPLLIFSETPSLPDDLLKLRGRIVDFDTWLDFSVRDQFSHRIATETEYSDILNESLSELNNRSLRLYCLRRDGHLDSFVSLVVIVRDSQRLKFSHGGTGIVRVIFKGRFEVEARNYAGPSTEFTLREVG